MPTLFVLLLVLTIISIVFYVLQSSIKQNSRNKADNIRKSKIATPRKVSSKHKPIRKPKYRACSCPYDRDKAGQFAAKDLHILDQMVELPFVTQTTKRLSNQKCRRLLSKCNSCV